MNNVGEFFFSSPVDPFDLSKDWARSDDDQRHRLVINTAVQTSTERATSAWEYLTHGFVVSGIVQAYSAPPFNITSGVTTIQRSAARPIVNGAFIERIAGKGSPFFTVNARISRAFRLNERVSVETIVEGFNLTNHRNVVTRNTNFGPGAYPTNPLPSFGHRESDGRARCEFTGGSSGPSHHVDASFRSSACGSRQSARSARARTAQAPESPAERRSSRNRPAAAGLSCRQVEHTRGL